MLKRFTTHTLMALAEASLIALLVVGLMAGAAFAGKPSGGGGGTLTLVPLAEDGVTNYGDQVTFEVETEVERPFVSVKCYQDGDRVYSSSAGFFDGYAWPWAQTFTLRSSMWTGGAADCTATLYYVRSSGRQSNLDTSSFHAEP